MDISMMYISSDGTVDIDCSTEYSSVNHSHKGKLYRRIETNIRERMVVFMEQSVLPSQEWDVIIRALRRCNG
jgi:hypothetical protein